MHVHGYEKSYFVLYNKLIGKKLFWDLTSFLFTVYFNYKKLLDYDIDYEN